MADSCQSVVLCFGPIFLVQRCLGRCSVPISCWPKYTASSSTPFQRSLQLAEFVRVDHDHRCAVSQTSCSSFLARDGNPYVEAHHIIPMAPAGWERHQPRPGHQHDAPMPGLSHVPPPRWAADAGRVLGDVLAWFEMKHGRPFADANSDLTLGTTPGAVLTMYGLS
jgi:hypothetical protein